MFSSSPATPTIHLYTICWNEEYMLSYFFRHYDPFVTRYVFFDNGSTDATRLILANHPRVEIRPFPSDPGVDSYVLAAQHIHNTCWKESRGLADWVIITAVDELLYAPQLSTYLMECARQGVTAIPALGFQMISATLPTADQSLLDLVQSGCPWTAMNKLSLFNPNKITETNQQPGRHEAEPSGHIKYPPTDVLLNLHFKYLSFEQTFKRHQALEQKLGVLDKEKGWGHEYSLAKEKFKQLWDHLEQHAIANVFAPNYNPHRDHSPLAERWWRPPISKQLGRFLFRIWLKIPEGVKIQVRKVIPETLILNILNYIFPHTALKSLTSTTRPKSR